MRKKLGIWGPVIALGVFMIAVLIFIFTAGSGNRGAEGHYVNGIREISLEDENYILINDVDSKSYIGSQVSDVWKAGRGEKVGTISSHRILTLAVLYEVTGDSERKYLVDSKERIYVRKDLYDGTMAVLAEESAFCDYRIVDSEKKYDALLDIDDEKALQTEALAKNGSSEGLLQIDDVLVTQDFGNRREIFAFTEDGLLYKAKLELFLYRDKIYVTTRYEDNSDAKKPSVLTGKLLPEELQEYFKSVWK